MIDWSKYAPYITPEEAMCKCGDCGIESADNMDPDFLDTLLTLRLACGFPFKYSSLYRCPNHPKEKSKKKTGTHPMGKAGDIVCSNNQAFTLNTHASSHPKIKSIRFSQKGKIKNRFVHLDSHDRGFNHIGSY
jgi:hypothetical protein